jgi:Na+-driven multidrug efflux pump
MTTEDDNLAIKDGGAAQDAAVPPPNPLRTEKIGKLLFSFSMPAIIGMILNAVYNIVDRMYIGHDPVSGGVGVTSLQYTLPLLTIVFGVSVLFGIGGSVVFSHALGERDHARAEKAMANALLGTMVLGVLMSALLFALAEPLMNWSFLTGAKPGANNQAVLDGSVVYLRVCAVGFPFQAFNVWGNNIMRADGAPRSSMVVVAAGAVFNVCGDALFVLGFGWGLMGAALATVIGQGLSALLILLYFNLKKGNRLFRVARIRLRARHLLHPDFRLMGKIAFWGVSAFVIQIGFSVVTLCVNTRLTALAPDTETGNILVAAMGNVNSLISIIILPIIGLSQGMSPIVAYNHGARKGKRVLKTLLLCLAIASGISVLGFAATRIFPRAFALIFVDAGQTALLDQTIKVIGAFFSSMPLIGLVLIGTNFFQFIGKSKRAAALSVFRQFAVVIPLIFLLPLTALGLTGIFWAQPFADFAAAVTVAALLARELLKDPLYRTADIAAA